ncbi:uncharacterized protein I206_102786 [Kwoniella pini CBS 10737]|uniref:Aminoglycoside phosphotransferase domain-containing protein n=1 Tax=Kwoniella pini CBS 10737 TaxID=1296096 RepID=A0A1B9I6B6_9TREE|nr:uncharacterized protein I206_03141 [Kwoniella pini CBS 10737]OCF51075.1 hypothetical protein I206_03141 [Kwoniella pini CBS 10737]
MVPQTPKEKTISRESLKYDYAKCDLDYCDNYALLSHRVCFVCGGNYCYDHVEDIDHHICYTNPPKERIYKGCALDPYVSEVIAIRDNLDYDAVKEEVESIRCGHKCTDIEKPKNYLELRRVTGSFNTHIVIHFDDDVKWVMRIRRKESRCMPEEAIKECHYSELATLKTLEDQGVKIARSFQRPADSKISEDLFYFYQEFVEGVPASKVFPWSFGNKDLTPAGIRFIHDYAAWTIDLEKIISPQNVGCLRFDEEGSTSVGPHIEKGRNLSLNFPYTKGPFVTAKQRWLYSIECRMKWIIDKRACSPRGELHNYLILLEMKDLVTDCEEMEQGPWYLKHYDLHQGNFRVDEETGELRGVIDWEWASFTCKAEAFAPPAWFGAFQFCSTELGKAGHQLIKAYDDLGRPDFAQVVRNSAKYQWLEDTVMGANTQLPFLNATLRSFLYLPDETQGEPKTLEHWTNCRLDRYSADIGLQTLLWRRPTQPLPQLERPPPISKHQKGRVPGEDD